MTGWRPFGESCTHKHRKTACRNSVGVSRVDRSATGTVPANPGRSNGKTPVSLGSGRGPPDRGPTAAGRRGLGRPKRPQGGGNALRDPARGPRSGPLPDQSGKRAGGKLRLVDCCGRKRRGGAHRLFATARSATARRTSSSLGVQRSPSSRAMTLFLKSMSSLLARRRRRSGGGEGACPAFTIL